MHVRGFWHTGMVKSNVQEDLNLASFYLHEVSMPNDNKITSPFLTTQQESCFFPNTFPNKVNGTNVFGTLFVRLLFGFVSVGVSEAAEQWLAPQETCGRSWCMWVVLCRPLHPHTSSTSPSPPSTLIQHPLAPLHPPASYSIHQPPSTLIQHPPAPRPPPISYNIH